MGGKSTAGHRYTQMHTLWKLEYSEETTVTWGETPKLHILRMKSLLKCEASFLLNHVAARNR